MSENMLFCKGDGRGESKGAGYQKSYQIFNKPVTKEEFAKAKKSIPPELPLTTWIKEEDMTKAEKKENSGYDELGGYLKVLSYKDAWAKQWDEFSKSDKQKFLDLQNFDPVIFEQITGIEVGKQSKETIRIGDLEFDKEEVEERLKDLKPIK